MPSGIQAGDLIVVLDFGVTDPGGPPADATPSGFTQASTAASTTARAKVSYKIAVGSESGASVNGMDGNIGEGKLTYVFRGNVPITSVVVNDPGAEMTDGNPVAQTVNASGAVVPLLVLAAYACGTGVVNPRTFTVGGSAAKDGEINVTDVISGDGDMWLAYKIYNSSPANVVVDMDDEGFDNTVLSCYLTCS